LSRASYPDLRIEPGDFPPLLPLWEKEDQADLAGAPSIMVTALGSP